MTKEEFRKFCRKYWEKPHSFAVIDVTNKKKYGSIGTGLISFTYLIRYKKIIILIINGRSFQTDREKHGTQAIVPNYSKRQQIEL